MKVLLATDGNGPAEAALIHLARLVRSGGLPGTHHEIVVLTVSETSAGISHIARAKELLAREGITARALWRVGADPVNLIVATAQDEHVDLVVLGCRPRLVGASDKPGSVSDGVLRRSPVPVLVVRDQLAG
ncbi:MAG: universal stress protein [Candidatus Sericytochromatia bacterium]|uniref:Universal stress protein n=1 Tax=Candidatus Tanganyikabacteria bacterium TaxID=2961651 RepID=A0A937X5B1_9BACT|nr:universal stress protein [Candidatus Tanganyikabacteria bacterium]